MDGLGSVCVVNTICEWQKGEKEARKDSETEKKEQKPK